MKPDTEEKMATRWEDYISAPQTRGTPATCRTACAAAFEPVRRIIKQVIAAQRPATIAVLGAGVLNDIPFGDLVQSGSDIHFVDWIPGIVDTGLTQSCIDHDDAGKPRCVFCTLGPEQAPAWCRRFAGTPSESGGVCRNFEPVDQATPACKAYKRGTRPVVHCNDVTGGYASAFARHCFEAVKSATSWRQAIKQAGRAARRTRHDGAPIEIADASVDLVTSSMLLSQFAYEPYQYLSKQVAAKLGPPSAQEDRQLAKPLAALLDMLTVNQIECHLDEVERIMAPDGRLFVAFEMFHYEPESGANILVGEMHRALEILGRRFDFDFDLLPARDSVVETRVHGEPSVVHAFLLRRRTG